MLIPPCPRCGYDDGVFVEGRARGLVELYYDSAGQFTEALYDRVYFDCSRTVHCGGCLRIRRDVSADDLSASSLLLMIGRRGDINEKLNHSSAGQIFTGGEK